MFKVRLFIFCLVFPLILGAQDTPGSDTPGTTGTAADEGSSEEVVKKKYTTTGIALEEAPQIDGELTDAIWERVSWGGDYIEFQPDENTAPSVQTKFKILYDAKNLYLAFKCYDPEPDKIERRLSRRDGFAGDWVEVNIDSYNDKRSAFSFSITAAGVREMNLYPIMETTGIQAGIRFGIPKRRSTVKVGPLRSGYRSVN